jgi:glucose-6-phosphate 1-dehydrogenase
VRITFQENFGTEGRAGYFNDYGIIRDIMQNHLMQVLTLIAMEAPASLNAEDVRDEKVKVLKQIRPILADDCVIGQYEGYQDDPQIQKINEKNGYPSRCPTFAVAVLYCDNERWSGVPFIMKAGKALKNTQTIVRVQFKKAPSLSIFGDQPQNELVIRIQPNEGIYYKMLAKMPGISQKAKDVRRTVLDLDLKKGVERQKIPEAYEKLIYDVLQGQSHNFVRRDELEQAWRIFDPLLQDLEHSERVPLVYASGSGGPREADALIQSKGFQKYTPTGMAVSGFSDDEVA